MAGGRGNPYADRLRDLLVDLLGAAGDLTGAVQERHDEFARRPTAGNWRALRQTATSAGADLRPDWAVQLLHERVAAQPAYVTELIDVLVGKQREDEAWRVALANFDRLRPHRRAELLELRPGCSRLSP